eukprot:6181371-Pleurochrysis_carterae.AAC.5
MASGAYVYDPRQDHFLGVTAASLPLSNVAVCAAAHRVLLEDRLRPALARLRVAPRSCEGRLAAEPLSIRRHVHALATSAYAPAGFDLTVGVAARTHGDTATTCSSAIARMHVHGGRAAIRLTC